MLTISQTNNPVNKITSPGLTIKDEFLPYVEFDLKAFSEKDANTGRSASDKHEVDFYSDENFVLLESYKKHYKNSSLATITTEENTIKIPLKIHDGTEETWDDDGVLEAKVSVNDPEIKIKYPENLPVKKKYGDDLVIELAISLKKSKEFFVDFFASDNKDDTFVGELKDVHCGRLKVSFVAIKSSKVGLRLTSNIENLPDAPNDYDSPPTFSEPKKSFEVANKYQDSYGMCFAVSMARVRKAYQDEFGVEVLSLNLKDQDYLYSGTITNNIPDIYFGYGVGGALAIKGYASLVNDADIWNGDLQEGAMLQYWYGDDLNEIKTKIKARDVTDSQGGHSVIFKSYIKDNSGNITGLNVYDYSGIDREFSKNDGKLFLGANLKDL